MPLAVDCPLTNPNDRLGGSIIGDGLIADAQLLYRDRPRRGRDPRPRREARNLDRVPIDDAETRSAYPRTEDEAVRAAIPAVGNRQHIAAGYAKVRQRPTGNDERVAFPERND